MFYALHRLYVLGWTVLVCGALVWLYPRTGISEPLADWYAVWKNQPQNPVKPLGELSGTVVKVLNGTSFTLRAPDRQSYNIALLGAVLRPSERAPRQDDLALASKKHLADLVLSNEVTITLTWIDPQHRGVGIVHCQGVNVNAAMVESGLVEFRPETIKGTPLLDQYAFMRAERRSNQRRPALDSDSSLRSVE